MSAYAFYFIGIVLVLFLAGFVGYYVYRLTSARRQVTADASQQLGRLLQGSGVSGGGGAAASGGRPAAGPGDPASALVGAPRDGIPGPSGSPQIQTPTRTYERGPGLRAFTEAAVFMRLDKSGEVSFQIGEKPAMPLKFLLDAKARSVLEQLSMRATADFGRSWAILASEDEEGRLTVTRLA